MSFPCPACGASARTRGRSLEEHEQNIYRTYYQCNNIECGLVFVRLSRLYALLSAGSRKLHSDLYNTASECDRLRYFCITSCGSGHLPRPTHPPLHCARCSLLPAFPRP